jgi:hypothetical protein
MEPECFNKCFEIGYEMPRNLYEHQRKSTNELLTTAKDNLMAGRSTKVLFKDNLILNFVLFHQEHRPSTKNLHLTRLDQILILQMISHFNLANSAIPITDLINEPYNHIH